MRLGTLPLLALGVMHDCAGGPMPLLWAAGLFIGTAVVIASFATFKDDPPGGVIPRWARRASPLLWIMSLLLIHSVARNWWPLHASFRASQPQLNQLALDSRAGKPIKLPRQIGNFNVTNVLSNKEVTIVYLSGADGGDGAKLIRPQFYSTEWRKDDSYSLDENWRFVTD